MYDLAESAPDAWADFVSYVVGKKGEDAVRQAYEPYSSRGLINTIAAAQEEVACDFLGDMLSSEDTLHSFTRDIERGMVKRNTVQKILDAIRRFIARLRGTTTSQRVARDMGITITEATRAVDMITRAMNATAQQTTTAPAQQSDMEAAPEQAARRAAASYSIDPNFASNIDTWEREGRPEGESFVLGSTGEVLQGLGAIESDIYMLGDKISTIMDEHPEITLDKIKRIPEILDDPVLILKSKGENRGGQNTRMVIFGSVKAQNGQPMLAVLDLRPVENHLVLDDMQKVSSVYTRSNAWNYVSDSEIMYADAKRTIPLLRTIDLRSNGERSIELQRSGSMGSISYSGQNVNLSGVKFSDLVSVGEDVNTKFSLTRATADEIAEAEQMEQDGSSREDIWAKIGVIRDAAGNWLSELDDSGMKYSRIGDVRFAQIFPDYAEYQQLMKKMLATNNGDEIVRASRNYVGEGLKHP